MRKPQHRKEDFDQAKQDFVALTSHQLRTPLSATRWFLEILLKEIPGKLNPKQHDLLERAYESNMRMINLVKDLLDTTRLDTNQVAAKFSAFSLASLVRGILKEHEDILRARNCNVEMSISKNVSKIYSDKTLVQQILENLIHNALKYSSGTACTVRVHAEENNNHAVIRVSDTGIGIPTDDQKRIFNRFFRAENAKKVSTHGTGLGLFLSQKLAHVLGGNLTFTSQLGQGSIFALSLPKKSVASKKR